MNEPNPSNVRPIYGGTVDTLKLYINGKEVPTVDLPVIYGTLDAATGILITTYRKENDNETN